MIFGWKKIRTENNFKEIHYWNFLKAFSIFLVVYCHMPLLNPTWYNNYSQLITYVAVPLFFMVNGAALFHGKFNGKKHLKKTLHLFLVSRIWRIFYLLFALHAYSGITAHPFRRNGALFRLKLSNAQLVNQLLVFILRSRPGKSSRYALDVILLRHASAYVESPKS